MRNLKKILALVLALVMSMSLLATANAFSDDKDIDATYNEAVSVLSGLKVFEGYEDGSFQPKGSITRAEVAAIIYRIVTGDVEDKQVKLYADYNKFTDVKSSSWYAGYVNYCANAELVKGRDGKTFDPQGKVTGYEALAMILRAVGYDKNGEFTGKEWQVQTAAVAKSLGITNNIIPGTLNTAASRETVAEILFRAILVPTVAYTPAFGYRSTKESLGWKAFKLEKIEGVVVANEYADLYSASTLAEGKTELETEDGIRALNCATALTDIGEARYAYVSGKTVYAIADTGSNTVWENEGVATSNIAKASGLKLKDAVSFLNFGGETKFQTSDWRIEYNLSVKKSALTETEDKELKEYFKGEYTEDDGAYVIKHVIRPDEKITSTDSKVIAAIFAAADKENAGYILGEVYVGTKSTEDVSDTMSYRQFVKEYLNNGNGDADIKEAYQGEWLKVVDNNNDGEAEYVFLTEFAMSKITAISKKGVHTLTALDGTDKPDVVEVTEIKKDDIITKDELAVDDIVVYTEIDGKTYIDLAEKVTESIDKRGIDRKSETITCGDNVYTQSHIGYADVMQSDITAAYTGTEYDLYLDKFGNVRLYDDAAYNRGFALLTDGYFYTDYRNDKFQATIFDGEDLVDVDVVDGKTAETKAKNFIDVTEGNDHGDKGTWKRLLEAGQVYFGKNEANDPFITNIAAYTVSEDAYTLAKVEDASNRKNYDAQELDVTSETGLKDKTLYAGNRPIQTTTDTVYYLVLKDGNKISEITTWTGYKNAPAAAELGEKAVAYAVTLPGDTKNYDVAQIVVFETEAANTHSLHFVYDSKAGRDAQAYTIGYIAKDETYGDVAADLERNHILLQNINFYDIDSNGVATPINSDYADKNIYAGEVFTNADVDGRDYVKLAAEDNTSGKEITFSTVDTPAFVVTEGKKTDYDVDTLDQDYKAGDKVIVVTGKKLSDVHYVINVTKSIDANKNVLTAVETLYDAILDDAEVTPEATFTVNGVGSYHKGEKTIVENLNGEFAKVNDEFVSLNGNTSLEITVTENMTVVGGYYDFKVNGETYYTQNTGSMKKADLLAAAGVDAKAGTYDYWVWGTAENQKKYIASNDKNAHLIPSLQEVCELHTGYVKVTDRDAEKFVAADSEYVVENTTAEVINLTVTGVNGVQSLTINPKTTYTLTLGTTDVTITVTLP